jgi:hypothetical protein
VQVDALVAAAIAVEYHSCSPVVAGIVSVLRVAVADAVGGVVAASSDHATVAESGDLARPALVVAEEALVPDAPGLETLMPCQRPERCAAILWVVEVLVVELVARAHFAVVVALIAPVVLSRRRLAGLLRNRTMLISGQTLASHAFILDAPSCMLSGVQHTYIPVLRPLSQVRVVNPAITTDMLPRAHYHVLRGCDVYDGWFSRVRIRHPYCYRKAICCAAKRDRQRSTEDEQER